VDRKVADSKENEGQYSQPLAVNQGDHYQANSSTRPVAYHFFRVVVLA
jgi:hypothetical protein